MSISAHSFTSFLPRHFQPGVRLGSTFAGARFYSSGAVADGQLRDEPEQSVGISAQIDTMRGPFRPQLYGMLEAQVSRVNIGIQRRLRHQQTDQVVGEQVNPQLLLDHLGRKAAQDTFQRCAYN